MAADLAYLADDTDLRPIWDAVHARLCAGASPEAINTVSVPGLTAAGIAQLRTWLDISARRRRGASAVRVSGDITTVPLRELLTLLAVEPAALVDLVEKAVGKPVANRSIAAQAAADRRDQLWQYASDQLPGLPQLVTRMRTSGVGEDDTEIRSAIAALAGATGRLPARPPIPLAKLAHDVTGDPHFFDLRTLNGTRLVAAIAERADQPEPVRPDLVRALLASAGVIADRLSSTVLLFNVQVCGDGPIDRRLRGSPTPVALTLLDLVLHPPVLARQTLTVVENPSVLEVAYTSGVRVPLACTSGQLRAIDHVLFQLAVTCHLDLRYAGDIDLAGRQIAAVVAATYGAELIAMNQETATEALRNHPARAFPLSDDDDAEPPAIYQEHDVLLSRILGERPDSPDR
ncbi:MULTISPECIES: TIGR02679 domain-containing protein [unclassified Frankia]|uniref:TIGR02679 domain-containing protein n=1 Tax=unclassified Frankia TaxID=2632575 RepID=UPI001EF6D725|nr:MULTISPECIES: TIGR02679 domain-containing protein [unclassified Frankia]